MGISRTVKRIENLATRRGIDVDKQYASTGSVYITLTDGDTEIVVRIADHAKCYCRETFSVDPFTGPIEPVLAWIRAHGETPKRWSCTMADAAEKKLIAAGRETARPTSWLVQVVRDGFVEGGVDERGPWGEAIL